MRQKRVAAAECEPVPGRRSQRDRRDLGVQLTDWHQAGLAPAASSTGWTTHEFDMFFLLLTVAGNESTRHAASGGLLAFFSDPGHWQRLLAEPGLIPAAAEEIVRWVSPGNMLRRTATCDVELGGQEIAEGDKVVVFYSSANRDADVFDCPDEFDIGRDPNPHVGFGGGGPHFCLGRHLAALELRVLLRALTQRMPDIALDGEVDRLRSNIVNGIKHMPVRFGSRGVYPDSTSTSC